MEKISFRNLASTWNSNSLLVLDLDSTLVLTHKRNEAILHAFAEENRGSSHQERREFAETLATIECRPCEYGYGRALQRVSLDRSSPILIDELATYWRSHFFSNKYLHCDLLHKGSLDFVKFLQHHKIPFVYLTGRPRPTMIEGSLESLKALGFPITAESLFMKPEAKMVDEVFKTEKIAELKKKTSQLVLIDNEPKILNLALKDHRDIQMIFIDTCHSPNVQPPSEVPSFKDFSEFSV